MSEDKLRDVPARLRDGARLFEERNAAYGNNYRTFGPVMAAMFPDGLHLRTADEMGRMLLFSHLLTKLTRYGQNMMRGGHADSLEDMAVYAQMAAELDDEARAAPDANPVVEKPAPTGGCFYPPAMPTTDEVHVDLRTPSPTRVEPSHAVLVDAARPESYVEPDYDSDEWRQEWPERDQRTVPVCFNSTHIPIGRKIAGLTLREAHCRYTEVIELLRTVDNGVVRRRAWLNEMFYYEGYVRILTVTSGALWMSKCSEAYVSYDDRKINDWDLWSVDERIQCTPE